MKNHLKLLSSGLGVVVLVGMLFPASTVYASIVATKHNL